MEFRLQKELNPLSIYRIKVLYNGDRLVIENITNKIETSVHANYISLDQFDIIVMFKPLLLT